MATFVFGYISDLSPVKDNIKLRVRILRAWLQPLYNNQQVKNMEMIVMNEHVTVRMDKLKRFQHHLKEGNALTIQRYSMGEIKPKFRIVYNAMRLSFLSNTDVYSCTDFNGSVHDFVWRPFKSITDLEKEEDGQFGLSTSEAHPQPTIRNRMPLSDITNCRVSQMQQQDTNVVTTPLPFGLNRSLTLVSQRPFLSNTTTNVNRTQRLPNSTKSVATR
nr:hypothetical protein [Tanacetum cinerariifolium]